MPVPAEIWRPTATLAMLRVRADLLARIREFFYRAGVLEVETPICSAAGTCDPAIDSLKTRYTGPHAPQGLDLWLHTSPEFAMKRLLAAGSGPIFQICKVFRDGELGGRHNPEFTLLEWYRPGFDDFRLMEEVAELVNGALSRPLPVEHIAYRELFRRYLGIDSARAGLDELRRCAVEAGIAGADRLDLDTPDAWLDLLLSHAIEPKLGRGTLCFVHDYPLTQAALAKIRSGVTADDPPVAARFELYMEGIEIANGFHELTDADEQGGRFEAEILRRAAEGRSSPPADGRLLDALASGLPDCAGVALGVDRLLMVLTGAGSIDEVLSFPLDRA